MSRLETSPLDSLSFFKFVSKAFQAFRSSPGYNPRTSSKSGWSKLFWGIALIAYNLIILVTCFSREMKNGTISIIANYIQLGMKMIVVNTVIFNSFFKRQVYHLIIQDFLFIDRRLEDKKMTVQPINSKKHQNIFQLFFGFFLLVLILVHSFNSYVNIVKYQMSSVVYWLTHVFSHFIYTSVIFLAIVLVSSCYHRICLINKTFFTISDSKTKKFKAEEEPRILETHEFEHLRQISEEISMLFIKINEYFGLVLLGSISVIFVENVIQSFYCFTIIANLSVEQRRTIWTFFASLNLVVVNLLLVLALTYTAEKVATAVNLLQVNVMHLKAGFESCQRLHNTLDRIKLTAYDFFSIDYGMLFGFLSAMTTYLVILIQFQGSSPSELREISTFSLETSQRTGY